MGTTPLINIPVWLVVKIFIIVGLLIYLVFAVVIVRQVKLMISTFRAGFEAPIKLASYIHLAFTIFVLIVAFLIL